MQLIPRPSVNFGPRRGDTVPDLIVLHYTAMQTAESALARLCDPAFEVSAHYLISEAGLVYQLVEEDMRAWHAGAGHWGGVADVNSRSIGIELANIGFAPFAEAQMAALERLLAGIQARRAIPPHRIIGHSDMAPGRKGDPGRRFDWRRLALQGLSVWPEALPAAPNTPDMSVFLKAAQRFGYGFDAPTEAVLTALRLRFRPWATGPLCAADMAVALDLGARFPVDGAGPLA